MVKHTWKSYFNIHSVELDNTVWYMSYNEIVYTKKSNPPKKNSMNKDIVA